MSTPKEVYEIGKAGDWRRVAEIFAADPDLGRQCCHYVKATTSGWTLLHQAAYFGSLPAARLLIKHGADIKRQSNTDGTPVDVATKRGHAELASKLQRAGAAADGCYKPPSDPSYWPSSCSWDETKKVTAPYDMVVAYGGGTTDIPKGGWYFEDSWGRVLVGWHGTVSPPCGMDGESILDE